MDGGGAVPYTYCEVYAPVDMNTHVGLLPLCVSVTGPDPARLYW